MQIALFFKCQFNFLKYFYFRVQSSNSSLNTRMVDMNLNNGNSSQHDEPYVKIHPDLQRMDVHEDNLPIGVCFFFVNYIILINYIFIYIYFFLRHIQWDQILRVMYYY